MYTRILACGLLMLAAAGQVFSADPGGGQPDAAGSAKRLELVGTYQRGDLLNPTSVDVSPDGKFVYAAAFRSATNVVFRQNPETGALEHVQTIEDRVSLDGATSLRLSPKGDLAAAAAFRSQSVVLYQRDSETGKLTEADSKQEQKNETEPRLGFAIGVRFSPDGRFVYILNSNGGLTSCLVLREEEDTWLGFASWQRSADLRGVRGLAFHPSGKTLFAASSEADCLVALEHGETSGWMSTLQIVRNRQDDVASLDGVFGVAVSPDGKHVYSTSGRFEGVDAISAFEFDVEQRRLKLVQELIAGSGEDNGLPHFSGGNQLIVSPDGQNVYAAATKSGSVACLQRDADTGRLHVNSVIHGIDAVKGAADVAVSPDGKYVFVAAEFHNAISVFRRQ